MSDKLNSRIQLAANVAIIIVALLTSAVLAKRYLLGGTGGGRPDPHIAAGTTLSLPGVDWAGAEKTLLLTLSTDCRFCTESAPFYRRLAASTAGRTDVRLVALLPQSPGESREYLSRHGVEVREVIQARPGSLGVAGTPTLILVNKSGSVIKSWVGRLPEGEESEVMAHLGG